MLNSYKDLKVWQKAIKVVEEIYEATKKLPKEEIFGLVSQMRRAAVSIPSNIAEGYKRQGLGEYIQFLKIADASAAELETQITIVKSVYNNIDFSNAEKLLIEVEKMLFVMTLKLKENKN